MNVKQEQYDDAEIQALAEKITAANKNRMVVDQQKTHATGVNQNVIFNSMMNEKERNNNVTPNCGDAGKAIDEDSVKGRFGWEIVGKNLIPYINREGEKYCAVRMVEMKALNKYLNYFHQDIYNCTCIRSYYITEHEGRLLNEINFKHLDYQFGREQFTQRDLIIRLSDAIEFYNFLCSCYAKLVNEETDSSGRSGFIRMDKKFVIPYTVCNDQRYVPLFYFEGETENLKQRANKLEGWDLSYLKFCYKVQGLRNELVAYDSGSVISLNDIKNYLPPGTLFEDFWPKKSCGSQLLISGNARNQRQVIQWTRQPVAPPTHPSTNNYFANITQINYHQEEPEELQPSPMIPIRQYFIRPQQQQQANRMHMDVVNQNSTQRVLNYNVNNKQLLLINQQTVHQQSARTQASCSTEEGHSLSNGQLISILEPPTSSDNIPYKMQEALVIGKLLPCINMKPYVYGELLVTVPDLITNFFNNIPVQSCQKIMKLLGIELYKPNNSQNRVLMESGKCQNMNEVFLVQVRKVIDFMPQLKYILGGFSPNMSNS